MTDAALQADQDLFRARFSGKLAAILDELADGIAQAKRYNLMVPHTILDGDIGTLSQAHTAVTTILKAIDQKRGVTRR